jgi:hypothetical protein
MSMIEAKRRKVAREVMRKAWKTYRRCLLSWATCLKICWSTVRFLSSVNYSKVVGVSFENRQQIIKRLSLYPISDIYLRLEREANNPYDPNAILVIAKVKYKGEAPIGYISKELALILAPLIDSGHITLTVLECITGLNRSGCSLGVNFSYLVI